MTRIINFLRSQWLLTSLSLIIIGVWLGGDYMNIELKSFFYTVSICIKNLIILTIPLLIIIFIANSLASISGRAFFAISLLFLAVFISNFLAINFSYLFYQNAISGLSKSSYVTETRLELMPLFNVPHYQIIKNDLALLIGLSLGVYTSYSNNRNLVTNLKKLRILSDNFLKYAVLPLLPLFVFGSLIKLKHEKTFEYIVTTYDKVFVYFFLAQLCYVILLYALAAGVRYKYFLKYIKNMMPAYITGLSTFSSMATMPVTIAATIKNTGNERIAHTVIPATVNIHMLGTAIGTNILVLCTFAVFNIPLPDFSTYINYAIYFAIAQFAVLGVSGGSVFATVPIIEAHLGLPPEALAIVSAMVILFDPIDTSFNISANGAFAIIFKKLFGKLIIKDKE